MINVDPFQRNIATHIVGGNALAVQFPGWLAAPAHVPVGVALRAAMDLTLDASRLLRVAALDK